jgi:fibronectin-binding autotransporter adhesin
VPFSKKLKNVLQAITVYCFCFSVRGAVTKRMLARKRSSVAVKNTHLKNLVFLLFSFVCGGLSLNVSQAQFTWNSTSNGNWGNGTNWAGGTAPTDNSSGSITWNIPTAGGVRISNNDVTNFTATSFTVSASNNRTVNLVGNGFTLSGDVSNFSGVQLSFGNSSTNFGNITLSNSISINATSTINFFGNLTETGGARGITKTGNLTVVFNRTNTYTGSTTISAGTLSVNGSSAISDSSAVSVASGAVFNLLASEGVGSIAGAGNVTLGSFTLTAGADNTSTTFSGNMSGGGGLTKTGSGTLTMSGSNAYTGTTTISGGTLTVSGGSAISNSSAVTVSSGAVFSLGGSETVGSIAGAGNYSLGSFALTAGGDNTNTSVSGVISGTGGGLTKDGTGTLTLSGANTYTGVTTLNSGTLSFGSIANGGSASGIGQATNAAGNLVLNGGTLDYTGSTASTDRGFTVSANSTIRVASGQTLRFTGTVSGSAGTLTKDNSGTLELIGNTVARPVTVNGGALAGNATFSGLVTLNTGASLVPGNGVGGLATMTLSNGLTLNSGSTVQMDLSNTSGSSDSIAVSGGALAYGGTLALTVSGMMPSGDFTNTYNLFTGSAGSGDFSAVTLAGSYSGSFTLVSANTWMRNTGDGTLWTFSEGNGTLTVIPEPSTWALMSFGAAFVLWRIRRRKAGQR